MVMLDTTQSSRLTDLYQRPMAVGDCNSCGVGWLLPADKEMLICPNCLSHDLSRADDTTIEGLLIYPPESVLPFEVGRDAVSFDYWLDDFIKKIPFRSPDLNKNSLKRRLERVYMPLWWVDADVSAQWWAEMGFNYEVMSHREHYDKGNVRSQALQETRIRWEPRVGLIQRHYENIPAPALEDDGAFRQRVGGFKLSEGQAYQPHMLDDTLIRLPQRSPADALPEAAQAFQKLATEQCQEASSAQHIRQFKWSPQFDNQNWTHVLVPIYITYYIGPGLQKYWVMINGQTGAVSGQRRADLGAARRLALNYLILAALAFIIGAVLLIIGGGFLNLIGSLAVFVALLGLLFALFMYFRAWAFNREQARTEAPQQALS